MPWQQQMKLAIRDVDTLCKALRLPADMASRARGMDQFPVFVPPALLARMEPENPEDPLLKQVWPASAEIAPVAGFDSDPLQESSSSPVPGMLHKYHGRVLLVVTGACGVHCRYCFRRHFPYSESPNGVEAWQTALDEIRSDKSIEEVLLSGGDPLTLADKTLHDLVRHISTIGHVKRLRVHSRMPVVIPSRLTSSLMNLLTRSRLQVVFVVHVNHGNEIDQHVSSALEQLSNEQIIVLNQSVLLKGVNDNADALVELSQKLIESRVMPYYLHQLDRVDGAAHFEVPVETGINLIEEIRARLPGYAVPRYVREIPGKPGKTVLC